MTTNRYENPQFKVSHYLKLMLVFRHFIAFSTAIALLSIGKTFTLAQTAIDPAPSENSAEDLLPLETEPQPSVAEIKKMTEEKPAPTEKDSVSQLDPTGPEPPLPSSQPYEPAPDYLNPSGNPLLFPTQPEEVDIEVVRQITLNQAIDLALRNNKPLKASRQTLERSRAELIEARAALYPTLQTTVDFSRAASAAVQRGNRQREQVAEQREEQGLPPDDSLEPSNDNSTNVNGNLQLSYNIYSGGDREARIRRAQKEVRRNELVVEQTAEQTRFDATDAYYELQRSDAQVAIAQASIEDATQSLRDAQLLEQAGLGTRFSVLQAEVDLANANQDLTRAIADQRTARRRLVEILSLGQQVELTAADEIREAGLWPLTLEDSIVQAYKNRAELEEQLLQREISEQDRTIALASIKPRVDLIANYNIEDDFDDTVGVADGYNFLARFSWTLFDGGQADARARQANRNIDLADTEFARRRNEIRRQVEEAYFDLIANQENITTAQTSIVSATESLRLARLRFQAGVGTQTDVINSQRDLTEARSRYLQAIVDYNRSLNTLQRSVSNLPDNRLFELR